MTTNLLDFDAQGLTAFFAEHDEKPFRARQVLRWMHRFGQSDFAAMTDIAKSLRSKLEALARITPPTLVADKLSDDGTRKFLFDVGGGNAIESVFIPEDDRGTLCISTQAGCALDCAFCSTGKQGFARNLKTSEIVGQLFWAERELRREAGTDNPNERVITNVVLMGMGEPLQNLEAVVPAIRLFLDDHAYGISRRRVTVSTSGLTNQMDKLAELAPVALAVSLHAPTDELRDKIMPVNRKHSLEDLMAACRRYLRYAPRDYITFEYLMLDGVNDSLEMADKLIRLVRNVPCKVNLIPFNPFPGSGLFKSDRDTVLAFERRMNDAGIVTTIRKTRGDDIDAACGQLAGQVKDRTHRAIRLVRQKEEAASILNKAEEK